MEKTKKSTECCSCDADFKKEISELEKEGTAPTKAEHDKKAEELKAAFEKEKKE